MDGMRADGTVIGGVGHPSGAREGRGPCVPLAFALSTLAHAALLGLLIAASETPPMAVPEAISVDLVPGSGAEAAEQPGDVPEGRGDLHAEPPPVVQTAEPAPETMEAVVLPDSSPVDIPAADIPAADVPMSEDAAQPTTTPPVPARKPAVKPAMTATRNPSPATSEKAVLPRAESAGNRDGAAATEPAGEAAAGNRANGSALADAGAGGGGADAMRVYLEEVRRRLQARLAVPAEARRLRLGGTVLVRFTVQRDGSVPGESMAVLSGPGVAVLERAALETVARTAPFPPPPKPATVEVPVLFAVSVR
ncbi:TonB family protein (plasmid) [Azospirillum argentinense]|uniref:TonB family protein n=1 Tax=Azospirillum argentinense TaxID=2970906 RepID=A0A4D8PVB6_9PROT|nr:TonB family protein [Azospirillum argentinense]